MNMKLRWSASCVLALASFASAQTTWHVDVHATAPGLGTVAEPYTSIQYALDQASTVDYDTLLVAPGVYPEQLSVFKIVTIRSTDGPLETVIRPTVGGDSVYLVAGTFGSNVPSLEGFTVFRVGTGSNAGAIRGGRGRVRHCVVIGNGYGFGIYTYGTVYVEHCTVVGHNTGIFSSLYGDAYVTSTVAYGNAALDFLLVDGNAPSYSACGECDFYSDPGNTQHNVVGEPLFVDYDGHDFHLSASSPLIGAGLMSDPGDPFEPFDDIGAHAFDASYAPFSVYCSSKTNSLGCAPQVGASGTPSLSSPLPFAITCSQELNQKLGLFFYGYAPKNAAYQGGWLCVQAPVLRMAPTSSGGNVGVDDCSGVYSFDFNAWSDSGADPLLEPGLEIFGQFWSRDSAASFTTNRSNALRFVLVP